MKSNNLVKIVSTIVGIVIAMFFVVLVVADPDQDIVARSPLLGQPALAKQLKASNLFWSVARVRGSC
jgi:hypothetical protein